MPSIKEQSLNRVYGKRRDEYLDLVRRFPLRPIRNDAELDDAIRVINSLVDKDALSAPEQDYHDVLSDLIEAYEDEHITFDYPGDDGMLRYLLDLKEVSQADLAKQARIPESTISEILAGKRKLNRKQVGKLATFFGVEPGAFSFDE